jgi:hypothetical protein
MTEKCVVMSQMFAGSSRTRSGKEGVGKKLLSRQEITIPVTLFVLLLLYIRE